VDAHPDADRGVVGPWLSGEGTLRVDGSRNGGGRPGEDDEEAIALGRGLRAVVGGDRRADELPMARQQARPATTQ